MIFKTLDSEPDFSQNTARTGVSVYYYWYWSRELCTELKNDNPWFYFHGLLSRLDRIAFPGIEVGSLAVAAVVPGLCCMFIQNHMNELQDLMDSVAE